MPYCKSAASLIVLASFFACFSNALGVEVSATQSQGDYMSGSGAPAHWAIEPSHTLVWNGAPYIPAGGMFQPRCMASADADSPANWSADMADLNTLKDHGVTQIVLEAGAATGARTPITSVPTATLQKVIDFLNRNGFTYGLDIDGYPASSLDAVVVNPTIYRAPNPESGAPVQFKSIEGLRSAEYFVVSTHDDSVLAHGRADVVGNSDIVVAPSDSIGNDTVVLAYPTRRFDDSGIEGRHCPDFWSDADDVRDNLLLYLGQIKFGPGLRFFLDPIRDDLGYYGAASNGMAPISDDYHRQFEAWLSGRYGGRLSVLERAWGCTDDDLPDITTAARAIPLWYDRKGIQSLYDPETDKLFTVDTAHSVTWQDIHDFQEFAMQSAMNGLATALKSGVADVPVVYRWNQAGEATLNRSETGFDGLMVDCPLHGDLLAAQAVGFALSDVEHARRTQWLLTELSPPFSTRTGSDSKQSLVGYGSAVTLGGDRSLLTSLGVRGLYVDALWSNSPSASKLLQAPVEQLDWLAQQSADLSLDASSLRTQRVPILYYPTDLDLQGAGIQQLACGAWWLPASFDSKQLDVGSRLDGYTMQTPDGASLNVVYSVSGDTLDTKFRVPDTDKSAKPTCANAVGARVVFSYRKKQIAVKIGHDPVIIGGLSELPLPDDAMADELTDVQRLIALGKKAGAPVDVFSQRLYYLQNNPLFTQQDAQGTDYSLLRLLDSELKLFVSPFIWIEAEAPVSQSFGSIIASSDASGGAYLWLDRSGAPPTGGRYSAKFAFRANTPGDYDIWASLAPSGNDSDAEFGGSAFNVALDSGTAMTPDELSPVGAYYGSLARSGSAVTGAFAWYRLMTVHIAPGDHTLTFTVTGKARDTAGYTLGIDAICLSRGDFHPDGTQKPTF
jgi:hypothetical protein